jgi:hypothetical protein
LHRQNCLFATCTGKIVPAPRLMINSLESSICLMLRVPSILKNWFSLMLEVS